jgi:threonine dehydrogenase-like Zn-dependent dehydrogenase
LIQAFIFSLLSLSFIAIPSSFSFSSFFFFLDSILTLGCAQIDLRFINRYRDTWPAGIACLEGGILDLKMLVSHVFPLEKALEAFDLCSDLTRGSIKIQIVDEEEAGIVEN